MTLADDIAAFRILAVPSGADSVALSEAFPLAFRSSPDKVAVGQALVAVRKHFPVEGSAGEGYAGWLVLAHWLHRSINEAAWLTNKLSSLVPAARASALEAFAGATDRLMEDTQLSSFITEASELLATAIKIASAVDDGEVLDWGLAPSFTHPPQNLYCMFALLKVIFAGDASAIWHSVVVGFSNATIIGSCERVSA